MKIGICEAAPLGACSYYRSIGPLSKLPKINPNIEIKILDQITWTTLFDIDLLFLARADSKDFYEMLEMAKNLGIPVWIDWDDNIFDIPEYNPAYKHYTKKSVQENVMKCVKYADIITVSTNHLKDFYSKHNKNIHVIENAFNDYNYKFEKVTDQFDSIFWRGSNTHEDDVSSVYPEMIALSKKHTEWAWVFVGDIQRYLIKDITNKFNIKEIDIITYNKFLRDNKAAITQVPLEINDFNKSKSNIAWIEGTFSGSAVIAPDLEEFKKPGIINYSNTEKYQYYLEKLINSKDFRKRNYLESFNYIQENLMLSDINKKRIEIIEELI